MRWAALVGAKPAKFALPRHADVLPVATMAPRPAAIMSGASSCASTSRDDTLTRKRLSRSSGLTWSKAPKPPATALWTSTSGGPSSFRMRTSAARSASKSATSTGTASDPGSSAASFSRRSALRASSATR